VLAVEQRLDDEGCMRRVLTASRRGLCALLPRLPVSSPLRLPARRRPGCGRQHAGGTALLILQLLLVSSLLTALRLCRRRRRWLAGHRLPASATGPPVQLLQKLLQRVHLVGTHDQHGQHQLLHSLLLRRLGRARLHVHPVARAPLSPRLLLLWVLLRVLLRVLRVLLGLLLQCQQLPLRPPARHCRRHRSHRHLSHGLGWRVLPLRGRWRPGGQLRSRRCSGFCHGSSLACCLGCCNQPPQLAHVQAVRAPQECVLCRRQAQGAAGQRG
jgi:hypothetical protein